MNPYLKQKVKEFPKTPGVYLFRDETKRIIYVGKAINLRNRVYSYFNTSEKDPKTIELIKRIKKAEWIETGSEFEALILEADLIKRYKPKYNIRFRDNKNYVYLKITKENYPRISVVHQIIDSEAEYLGPYTDAIAVRNILKMARRIFPYCSCNQRSGKTCLYFHLGLCLGHDEDRISKKEYKKNIRGIKRLFSGEINQIVGNLQRLMKKSAKEKKFELAAQYRDKINYLESIRRSRFISERDLATDVALLQLRDRIGLRKIPQRIECFDVSGIMGASKTASMVTFINGIAAPSNYRRFQIKSVKGIDDYASLVEVLKRRFLLLESKSRDSSFAALPNLIILDGGKGQLSAVIKRVKIPAGVVVISLAKKREQIFSLENNHFKEINLEKNSEAYFLVQRIRDEAHRFAISYYRKLKLQKTYESSLDDIKGVGPKTKKKLLDFFGTIESIKKADFSKLSALVGRKLAQRIKESL